MSVFGMLRDDTLDLCSIVASFVTDDLDRNTVKASCNCLGRLAVLGMSDSRCVQQVR